MLLAELVLLQLAMFLFSMNPWSVLNKSGNKMKEKKKKCYFNLQCFFPMNPWSVLNKITLLLMQYATSFLLCNRSFEVYTAVSYFTRRFWWSD